jgi:predicted RNA-binding Zn-ribbon protein involved in translation (DUF1610 family)
MSPPSPTEMSLWRAVVEALAAPRKGWLVTVRNSSVHITCPHCGNSGAELLPPFGDRSDYRCPHCGAFSVDGTQEHRFNTGHADPREAQFIVRNGRRWLKE